MKKRLHQHSRAHFNQQGNTLVSVLVSTVLIGILSLAVAELVRFSLRNQNNIEAKFSEINIVNDLRGWLNNNDICMYNVKEAASLSVFHTDYQNGPTGQTLMNFYSIDPKMGTSNGPEAYTANN